MQEFCTSGSVGGEGGKHPHLPGGYALGDGSRLVAPIGRAPCDALSPRMLRIIGELAEHWRRVDDIEGVVIHMLEHMLCLNRRPAQWTEQRCLHDPTC